MSDFFDTPYWLYDIQGHALAVYQIWYFHTSRFWGKLVPIDFEQGFLLSEYLTQLFQDPLIQPYYTLYNIQMQTVFVLYQNDHNRSTIVYYLYFKQMCILLHNLNLK